MFSRPLIDMARWGLVASLLVLLAATQDAFAESATEPIHLQDARERGALSVGSALANLSQTAGDKGRPPLLKLDYSVDKGAIAGAWIKAFPDRLNADQTDVVRVRVRTNGPSLPISVALEIKGLTGVQRIPVNLKTTWSSAEEMIDWPLLKVIKEVVLVVQRVGEGEPIKGTMEFDASFARLPCTRKLGVFVPSRILGVLLLSILFVLLMGIVRAIGRKDEQHRPGDGSTASVGIGSSSWIGDLVYGVATVFLVSVALGVYLLGEKSALESGWFCLLAALAGAVLGQWLKSGLTGRSLTPFELFLDAFVTGLFAASSSSLAVLQVPSVWSQTLMLSRTVAAAGVFVYHLTNAYGLAMFGRHLGPAGGFLIACSPYLVGSLLLLRSHDLLQGLGVWLTTGTLTAWPILVESSGRVLVVFALNTVFASGLCLVTKRTVLCSIRGHLALLTTAILVVAAPAIADVGSGANLLSCSSPLRWIVVVLTTLLSQAGLWAEVYLVTGMVMDAIHGKAPTRDVIIDHAIQGIRKGMVYGGCFMGLLHGLGLAWNCAPAHWFADHLPLIFSSVIGALLFPLAKTIMETFDGSQPFFPRVRNSYGKITLYARGLVVGSGFGYAITQTMSRASMGTRIWFGLFVGITAFAGVNLVADFICAGKGRGRVQSWRVYLVDSLLGGFIGAAIGFYLDTSQVALVQDKFQRYLGAGRTPEPFGVYPFLSKWGFIDLGQVTGGVNLLFAEALAGVISWSIPAWLFAINRTFMQAYFRKESAPIRSLFSPGGLVGLTQNMIEVLRWGLWMSPIINSFLRPMGDPTWYNQDGAIRTALAIVRDATMSPEAFRSWSLDVFIALLAYDLVRILIWIDHMGLRVATLVNLSFLGMDRLDQRLARFLGPAATARCIPEAVKRFTTWAPLLIPFYIPRGPDWDLAWNQAEAIKKASSGSDVVSTLAAFPVFTQLAVAGAAILVCTAIFSVIRWLSGRIGSTSPRNWSIGGPSYEVVVTGCGEITSRVPERGYDVTRRSYDRIDPAGRTVFVADVTDGVTTPARAWPLIGNHPSDRGERSAVESDERSLTIVNVHAGIKTTIEITLPEKNAPVELWSITLENLSTVKRVLKVVPYLEWVLNRPDADRGHTQYNRLFAEMEYVREANAIFAWDKHSKAMGILASDLAPDGFLTSRIDFIGRGRSLWTPRILETMAFTEARNTDAHPTFDPIGSLLLATAIEPGKSERIRLVIGLVKDKKRAIELISRHLENAQATEVPWSRKKASHHRIAHGEIPPGTPQPYSDYSENGRTLRIHTPFTPRPYDHTMSNNRGHVVVVTNRGLHTTSNGNSQQNRLTPDWPDTVTKEVPSEAFYLFDMDKRSWHSPTYHPINDASAGHEVEFGVDGTAVYRSTQAGLSTELTVFVPPDDPVGVYLLTVKNLSDEPRRIRLAPYFQMVLASQPEHAGPLEVAHDPELNALFFENPRSVFRTGPAFAVLSGRAQAVETKRGRFFGARSNPGRPQMVEQGEPDALESEDDRPIAAFLTLLEIAARGECTVWVLLGQADDRHAAESIIRKFRDEEATRACLSSTRAWWLSLMDTVRVETSDPAMDHYLDWLKYQALAERIWARRGFYQASGAFGFRDQLQDSVNLIWMDPAIARRQIVLHASQQFLEGDVVHWFHRLQDGRTGFAARTHASDNLLWLAWAVGEYVASTGDTTLLDEETPYLDSDVPFPPLPEGKHGMGFDPLRSSRTDPIYRHCLKAIDLVLGHRMGAHGLPLIGTGDWNDGLDEIGSEGKGESVWLGFFLYVILDRMMPLIEKKDGLSRKEHYLEEARKLKDALEKTWREDRYLRAIHDDGTEIGVSHSGIWEIDALTAAWAVMSGINPDRGRIMFETALRCLEKETTILLGWPSLREDTEPYLGRSSWYPEGVRENGMYCHGVQWLVGAARILAEQSREASNLDLARSYREAAYRLWLKISPIPHVVPGEIETYGGQPNKQSADMLTTFDPGRMIWHGYTGAAGWLFRQALEGVLGARLVRNEMVLPPATAPARNEPRLIRLFRDARQSPLDGSLRWRGTAEDSRSRPPTPSSDNERKKGRK